MISGLILLLLRGLEMDDTQTHCSLVNTHDGVEGNVTSDVKDSSLPE